MPNHILGIRKCQNLYPVELSNKDKYYSDLLNIERSWSG